MSSWAISTEDHLFSPPQPTKMSFWVINTEDHPFSPPRPTKMSSWVINTQEDLFSPPRPSKISPQPQICQSDRCIRINILTNPFNYLSNILFWNKLYTSLLLRTFINLIAYHKTKSSH